MRPHVAKCGWIIQSSMSKQDLFLWSSMRVSRFFSQAKTEQLAKSIADLAKGRSTVLGITLAALLSVWLAEHAQPWDSREFDRDDAIQKHAFPTTNEFWTLRAQRLHS
jgi:hypothetical protein